MPTILARAAAASSTALLLIFLGACSGGSAKLSADTAPPAGASEPAPPAATTGSLALTIAGLPQTVQAVVTVTGPAGFSRTLGASDTLASLQAGTYTINAAPVPDGGAVYVPKPLTQQLNVAAGQAASITISYAPRALTLAATRINADFTMPVFATAPAGDARLFVVEQGGRIRIVANGAVQGTPFLDLSGRISSDGEHGLLSMAFDPQYASNGLFFVYFTDTQGNIAVERYQVARESPDRADPASALRIITIAHPTYVNHNGGQVAFGPDGMLYMATGDGGGAGDPNGNAQNPTSLLGKMLRLDVSAATSAAPYAIPPTNPYANGIKGRAEIWALGLRNPWRYAFDAPSGQLYIADVGQEKREEVNIVAIGAAGLNFGWNTMEGTLCYSVASCERTGLVLPAFEYDHGDNDVNGCSISGGFVYRGAAIPELTGNYLYSDFCKGFLKSVLYTNGRLGGATDWPIGNIGRVNSFGVDGAGELLMLSNLGVYRLVKP